MRTPKSVGIIGWYEGLAGLIDSWLSETDFAVKCFISTSDEHQRINRNAHSRFRNKKFSYPEEGEFKGRPLIQDRYWYLNPSKYPADAFIVALDNNRERLTNINEAIKADVPLMSAIHPTAILMSDSQIGQSCIICAKTVIGYKATLGRGVIVNTGSQLDHHVVVEDGVSIDPGCVVAGNVLIKKFAKLHTSTTIINKIIVGESSVTGAGSLIIRDVDDGAVVVGVPAHPIRE